MALSLKTEPHHHFSDKKNKEIEKVSITDGKLKITFK